MAKLSLLEPEPKTNPLDIVEDLVCAHEWTFDREGDNELAVQVRGQWCDLHMWFAWRVETGSLFFTCALDMRVPEGRRRAVYPLLATINERLWLGHFELWSEEGWPTFRHTLLTSRETPLGVRVVEELVDAAHAECDRYYPAFQFVIWGGKSADEAVAAALIEPAGEA